MVVEKCQVYGFYYGKFDVYTDFWDRMYVCCLGVLRGDQSVVSSSI